MCTKWKKRNVFGPSLSNCLRRPVRPIKKVLFQRPFSPKRPISNRTNVTNESHRRRDAPPSSESSISDRQVFFFFFSFFCLTTIFHAFTSTRDRLAMVRHIVDHPLVAIGSTIEFPSLRTIIALAHGVRGGECLSSRLDCLSFLTRRDKRARARACV